MKDPALMGVALMRNGGAIKKEDETVILGTNDDGEVKLMLSAQSLTANTDSGAASSIVAGVCAVEVVGVTNDANDWIVLPSIADVPVGHTIKIACNAGGNFEMRTPTSSGEKINTVDCDGTQEYLCTDTEMVTVTKVSDSDGWVATGQTALGAIATAVVPD